MSSDWMKVMLDEIARKKAQAEQERLELERRRVEQDPANPQTPPETDPVIKGIF